MSLVSASTKRVGNGGFGTLGSLIPAESFFFDDVADTNKVYRAEITRFPSGELFAFNDGSFIYTGGDSSFDYSVYEDGSLAGSYTVTLGEGGAVAVTSTIIAGLPIPTASVAINIEAAAGTVSLSINAGLPIPTASAAINIEPALNTVSMSIIAGLPIPTASASINVQAAPVSVIISAGLPIPTASISMYTGEPVAVDWVDYINEMVSDGRFVIIQSASRFVNFND